MNLWMWFILLVALVQSTLCGIIAADLARVKGHDTTKWGWYGFLFGLIGLWGAVGLPDRNTPGMSSAMCPACGGAALYGYRKCRNCGEALVWHDGNPMWRPDSEVYERLSELAKEKRQQKEVDDRQDGKDQSKLEFWRTMIGPSQLAKPSEPKEDLSEDEDEQLA